MSLEYDAVLLMVEQRKTSAKCCKCKCEYITIFLLIYVYFNATVILAPFVKCIY